MALLVDDEQSARETLREILEDLGLEVKEAPNGRKARDLLLLHRFDIAILDIRLPDTDGTALLEEARLANPDTMCIMASGSSTLQNAVDSLNKGAYAYLIKPVSPHLVETTIQRALQQQRLALENQRLLFQLQALSQLTDAGLSSLELGALLPDLLARLLHACSCDCGVIYLLDADRGILTPAAASGVPVDGPVYNIGEGLVGLAAEGSTALLAEGHPEAGDTWDLALSLVHRGKTIGALALKRSDPILPGSDEYELLQLLCERAGVLIGNARLYDAEKTIAETLVQSFLSRPPERADMEIADRYIPVSQLAQIGGDYYDFINLGNGRLGILIGDVCGKGLTAAVYTARAKDILYAYARENPSPAWVVTRVNLALQDHLSDRAMFTTLFYGIFDPTQGTLLYTNAAHPAPMLFNPNTGEVTELNTTGGVVGALEGLTFAEELVKLDPGSTLALFTDGVTEARLGVEMLATEGVREVMLSCGGGTAEEVADAIYSRALEFSRGELRDDVAIVVLKYTGPSLG